MKKTIAVILAFALMLILPACGPASITESSTAYEPESSAPAVSIPAPESAQSEASAAESKPAESVPAGELTDFHSVKIEVMGADVYIQTGETWGLDYKLSPKEPLKHCRVENGTLIFTTSFDVRARYDFDDWYITVTVPEGTEMDHIAISTVVGDVEMDDFAVNSVSVKTTAGDLDISIPQNLSAKDVLAESVSGSISIEGNFDRIDAKTVAGSCEFTGTIRTMCEIETVSGSVEIESPHEYAMHAESTSEISYNDTTGRFRLDIENEAPVLDVRSVAGKITVETNG